MRAADNPFAVHRVLRLRYRLDGAQWRSLLDSLERAGWRGSIVGSHGSGKTTLLEDLGDRLAQRGWHVIHVGFDSTHRRLPRANKWSSTDFVLVDGVEQLGSVDAIRLRWRARHAGGFVVTSHDERWQPVIHRCRTSATLLSDIVSALGRELTADDSRKLLHRHHGNVRDALRELYDRAAALPLTAEGRQAILRLPSKAEGRPVIRDRAPCSTSSRALSIS